MTQSPQQSIGADSVGASMIYTTFPSMDAARAVARALIEPKLAACVNIIPAVVSIYNWDGAVCEEAEVAALVKTRRDLVARVMDAIAKAHPYATPALVAYDIVAGSDAYLDWIAANTVPLDAGGGPIPAGQHDASVAKRTTAIEQPEEPI